MDMTKHNSDHRSLLEYYDTDTILWLLNITDKYRKVRESRLSKKWQEYCLFQKEVSNINDFKRSTIRSLREGHHPLGCLNIPLVTPKFLWILAGIIGDGDAVVYHLNQKQLDMFVVRLKTKDEDFCSLSKEAFNEAGIAATSYPIKGENSYRYIGYSLLVFSMIKAIRKETGQAVNRLLRPLLVSPIMKRSFIKGCADSEGYVHIKWINGRIAGYDIYVFYQ